MKNVDDIKINENYVFLNTGSPHHVVFENNLEQLDVKTAGYAIRHSELYGAEGCNINFVSQISDNSFAIRTYERGVEDETLSCGTGATAVAVAMSSVGKTTSNNIKIQVQGGTLEISFKTIDGQYKNVFLKGAALFVYKGEVVI
jgi:diaminopimelate epimerase